MSNFRIYNETLCPDLWDSAQHLDPKIRANLLQMANDFYEKTELPAPIIDVYLMGSAANYNWTPDSDIDVHVIIDYSKLQMPPETAKQTVKTVGAQWNSEHNILIKGHKVEMNLQNSTEQKPYVMGIYSLNKDQWLRKPFKMSFNLNRQVLKFQYETMKNYVNNAIRSRDREQMKSAKKYLDAYRQYGLDTYGELSYENIIYKMLRARGLIKQLKDSITQVYDKQMTVAEVGEKDINQSLPTLNVADDPEIGNPNVDRSYWDKMAYKQGFNIDRLTLDELKALREKARRLADSGNEWSEIYRKDFEIYDNEIKRRMGYINAPITESPLMTKRGKKALAGDKPLRGSDVMDVIGNIVVIRQPNNNGFFAEGWTLVYFMDSEESAKEMAEGKIPYLMIPRGTYLNGGSPITDVWKQKFQKPGTEHILGLIEGHTDEGRIFIDMISVRPGWKRNHIAKLMIDRLKKTFDKAKVSTSTQTTDGEKLFKGLGVGKSKPMNEGFGSGIPEKDRLKIKNTDGSTRRWQIRSKDAPKTPKMPTEDIDRIGSSAPNVSMNGPRKNLFPEPIENEIDPDVKKILSAAEKVLDKKAATRPFFEIEYIEDLVGDIIAMDFPHATSDKTAPIIQAIVRWLARDYDIRNGGNRIGEAINPKRDKYYYVQHLLDLDPAIEAGKLLSSLSDNLEKWVKIYDPHLNGNTYGWHPDAYLNIGEYSIVLSPNVYRKDKIFAVFSVEIYLKKTSVFGSKEEKKEKTIKSFEEPLNIESPDGRHWDVSALEAKLTNLVRAVKDLIKQDYDVQR